MSISTISFSSTIQSQLTLAGTLSGNAMVSDQYNVSPQIGTGAGKADGIYSATGTVTAGTPVVIDFTSLHDPFGSLLAVAAIVAIKITNTSDIGAGQLQHGGGTTPVYGTALPVDPKDCYFHSFSSVGLTVDSSAKLLTLNASTGTVNYKLTAAVRSA